MWIAGDFTRARQPLHAAFTPPAGNFAAPSHPACEETEMLPDARMIFNFAAFQVAWFACVLGAANDVALAGALTVAVAVAVHLMLARRWRPEALLVLTVTAIGLCWDSALVSLGLMSYPTGNFAPGLAPHWILAMWALFATTLNLSMGWIKGRPVLAMLLGAIGGPLAYLAGHRLGGVEMAEPGLALAVQGLGWAVMMPLLARLAERLNGFQPAARALIPPRPLRAV
jgi:hypothetical protein